MRQTFKARFPIDSLAEHPDNPRIGDEDAIDESMEAHGFFGAVLVQESTLRIIAGNHRTRVASRRGESTVPVLLLDVDDDEARRILLADNRTNDLAHYNDPQLAALLEQLSNDGGLAGTGFDEDALSALLAKLAPPGEFPEIDPSLLSIDFRCPSCGYEWSGSPSPGGDAET